MGVMRPGYVHAKVTDLNKSLNHYHNTLGTQIAAEEPGLAHEGLGKVRMMTDVACFCGCCFSFDGGASACPKCGQYATVRAASTFKSTARGHQHEQPVPAMTRAGQDEQTAGACWEWADTSAAALAGVAINLIAPGPGTGPDGQG